MPRRKDLMQNEDKQGLSEFMNVTRERFLKAGTGAVSDLDGDHAIFTDLGEAVGKTEVAICDTTSNPAPLGLFAFVLPWSKYIHIIATPMTLLANRGGE
jgi:hypothetical protein